MSHCHCGEFDRPTIAPDEFGETCFHERDKCEVPPVPVPIETVLRLTRARAEKAEAAIQRVREQLHKPWKYECECCTRIWIALEGDSDE